MVSMANVDENDVDEKPLDPEVEKVRRKMVRLLAVSIGIMFIGVMAVLGAIVYRLANDPAEGDPSQIASREISLPAGFTVEDVALDGSRVLFYGADGDDGARRALIFDTASGTLAADITVSEAP